MENEERLWTPRVETGVELPKVRLYMHPYEAVVDDAKVGHSAPSIQVLHDFTLEELDRGRRVLLTGAWVLRQYRRPMPCGALFALAEHDRTARYVMETRE